MALFEDRATDNNEEEVDTHQQYYFPTHPPFLCPVEIKETDPELYGAGHKGVFAVEVIPHGTEIWVWTDRIQKIHHTDLPAYIDKNYDGGNNRPAIQLFLRQGFVFPPLEPSSSFRQNTDTMTTVEMNQPTTTYCTQVC